MKKLEQTDRYDDIINLPHHVSVKYPQMTLENRAAQFAPFAALTGHNDAIKETARLTDRKADLDADEIEILDRKLQYIRDNIATAPAVTITYFVKDKKKIGGEYRTVTTNVKKINDISATLITTAGDIPVTDVMEIWL